MGHITVWACGDLRAAISVCEQLRLLGCKARVHSSIPTARSAAEPWRRGPHVLVGDGRDLPYVDVTGCTDVLAFGEAAYHTLERAGGATGRRPPGLIPTVRTLTCRRDQGILGPKNTHYPVEAVTLAREVTHIPKHWGVEAVEARGDPAVLAGARSVLCLFSPRGPSLTGILDKVTRMWGTHRCDPAERALNRAITATEEQVQRGDHVVLGYSGGLTSAVSGYVLKRALRERVTACHVRTGLEYSFIQPGVTKSGLEIDVVDARQRTLDALEGTTDIHERRWRMARVFRDACLERFPNALLSQGATYESLLTGAGRPALQSSGLVQPLENITRGEVELIAKQCRLQVTASVGPPSGYADTVRGPFSAAALQLCRVVDLTLGRQLTEAKTPIPGVRLRHTFVVDVWDRECPRVTFGFEETDNGKAWSRMLLREGGLGVVVDALRTETGIRDLKVAYDVSLPLSSS
jgi:hypothetical protein